MTRHTPILIVTKTLLLALVAGLLALPASAAQPVSVPTEADPPTLVKHLSEHLQSRNPSMREAALLDVITLADCTSRCTVSLVSAEKKMLQIQNDTGLGTIVDLDRLVPDLIKTYRSGPADGHRLLALAALIKIGNEKALEQIVTESSNASSTVDRATQRNLAAFYLEKYPELWDKTRRTRILTIEDVQRAKSTRVRVAARSQGN